jgi:plastocyanin
MSTNVRALLWTTTLLLTACGGSDPPSSPTTNPPTTNPNVITISSGGVASPKQLTVSPGTRVLFVNSHSRRHDMTSDLHPDHQDCPELNQVGLLNPTQSRESGNLVAVRSCGFHDHEDPDNANLRGTIIVR